MNAEASGRDCEKSCFRRDGGGGDASSEFAAFDRSQVSSGWRDEDTTSENVLSAVSDGEEHAEEVDTVSPSKELYLWTYIRLGNFYEERCKRFKIVMPPYVYGAEIKGIRFGLYELNSPRFRHTGKAALLKSFDSLRSAKAHATTLVPWERISGTKNGWKRGNVMVTCKSMRRLPNDQTDDFGKQWSVYLYGTFVEHCHHGKKAQEVGDELYDSDEAGLLED